MRRRLLKIRQLLASGQKPDITAEETSVLMFGSVLQPGATPNVPSFSEDELMAAIDEQLLLPLVEDQTEQMSVDDEQAYSQARPISSNATNSTASTGTKRLGRSNAAQIEVNLRKIVAAFDTFPSTNEAASRFQLTVRSFDIIDHIHTSTWRKFLTEMRSSDGGGTRSSDTSMLRLEMSMFRAGGQSSHTSEIVAKVRIIPLT